MPLYALKPKAGYWRTEGNGWPSGAEAWPLPSVVFQALHAALHRTFPQVQLWERTHPWGCHGQYDQPKAKGERFGSLTLAGPFPCRELNQRVDWFFPCPADVVSWRLEPNQTALKPVLLRPIQDDPGRGNLPAPLRHLLGVPLIRATDTPAGWWSKSAMESYLRGEATAANGLVQAESLYALEPSERHAKPSPDDRTCPPAPTRAALRVAEGVSFGLVAAMPLGEDPPVDGLDQWLRQEPWLRQAGAAQGIGRLCSLPIDHLDQLLPISPPVVGWQLKWILLSPAVFPQIHAPAPSGSIHPHPGGWLPNWVDPTSGRVLLKKGNTQRSPGESRLAWRQRVRRLPEMDCHLVAARIPGLVRVEVGNQRMPAGSSRLGDKGCKTVQAAVPAGSVYYFEGPDAAALGETLSWHGSQQQNVQGIVHRRSAWFGEQGFGLGVCGAWEYLEAGLSMDHLKG